MGTRYVAIDVETPNMWNSRISSLGYAVIEDGEIVDAGNFMVNPGVDFHQRNIALTGIHPEDVENAPLFPSVWEDFKLILRDGVLIAHNAPFDLSVLAKAAKAYGVQMTPVKYLCTLSLSRRYLEEPSYRLEALCERYHIPLEHHHAGSDSLACAILFQMMLDDVHIPDFSPDIYDFTVQERPRVTYEGKVHYTDRTRSINELLNLLDEVAADGVLTEQEALIVSSWCHGHAELNGEYPYDIVIAALQDALEDGVLEPHELSNLLSLFQEVTNPVESGAVAPATLDLDGKVFCLSGDFQHGAKKEIAKWLEQMGGTAKGAVSKKVDYLIVGGCGSDAWAAGNYGSKIKKAMELQQKGASIQIIKECDLFAALGVLE